MLDQHTYSGIEIRCQGCGVEITWAPVVKSFTGKVHGEHLDKHQYYCCQDCPEGLGCDCGARMEMDDERREGAQVGAVDW
jgi:hypothetical protein